MKDFRGLARSLDKLDAALVAVPYQWLVNLSQRKKEWWVEQCAFAMFLTGVWAMALADTMPGWFRVAAGIAFSLGAAMFFLISRVPPLMENLAADAQRRALDLVFSAFVTALLLIKFDSACVLLILHNVAWVSAHYFAACEPPAPPMRRSRLHLGDTA